MRPDSKEMIETNQLSTPDMRLGRDISYGVQQTFACWVTDFIDPPVSRYLQNTFGNPDHEVTHKHVWWGEILGDSSALFAFLFLKRIFGAPIDRLIDTTESRFDGYLTRSGAKALSSWADKEHIAPDDPRYQQKLSAYKHYQAENMVDSSIIATSATVNNVVLQRYVLGNRQALPVILGSKLVGAAATLSLMLGLRTVLPVSTKSLDDELSERYFAKIVHRLKRLFGVEDTPEHGAGDGKQASQQTADTGKPAEINEASWAARLHDSSNKRISHALAV